MTITHPHPCNFRLHRYLDRGWGEIAFEYRWDSTSGEQPVTLGQSLDLAHCHLYELTHYSGSGDRSADGLETHHPPFGGYPGATAAPAGGPYATCWFCPPAPPFVDWKFRDPTDGRSGPVGLECFPASQGWAWDRHKTGGPLVVPRSGPEEYVIVATQAYRFFCDVCGVDEIVPGPHGGPHPIIRAFRARTENEGSVVVWRYSIMKHDSIAWMDLGLDGFLEDSLGLEYGPFWLSEPAAAAGG